MNTVLDLQILKQLLTAAHEQAEKLTGVRFKDQTSKETTDDAKITPGIRGLLQLRNPPAYAPCTTPLDSLKAITIDDLKLETHHRGCYILLKVTEILARGLNVISIKATMEEGDETVDVQLFHQDHNHDFIDTGHMIKIKEPYLSIVASDQFSIRVDHPSDVIIPEGISTHLTSGGSATSYMLMGDKSSNEEKFLEAIKYYTKAIAHQASKDEINIILEKRAFAFLNTEQYDTALLDTGFPNFGSTPSHMQMFQAAVTLYYLGWFDACLEVLSALFKAFPDHATSKGLLDRVRNRCCEQEKGVYNFKQMQQEVEEFVKEGMHPHIDYATFSRPVKVRQTPNKGRGLFTTKAVKAGDLLLVEKAFAYAFADRDSVDMSIPAAVNIEKERFFSICEVEVIRIIIQKLYKNSSLGQTFTELYHGDYKGPSTCEVDSSPVVDKYLIVEIVSLNSFDSSSGSNLLEHQTAGLSSGLSSGVWIKGSYINHSCVSNAQRAFLGDMMIVRATQDINAGEEVLFWYKAPFLTDPKVLREKLKKQWGFMCDCCVCQDTESTAPSTIALRTSLVQKWNKASLDTDSLERDIARLNSTYQKAASNVPRLQMKVVLHHLVLAFKTLKMPRKVIQATGKFLEALGFLVSGVDHTTNSFQIVKWGLVPNHLLDVFLAAHEAFKALKLVKKAKKAKAYAKVVYRIVMGHDDLFESFFNERK